MKLAFKIIGWILAGIVALFLIALLVVYLNRDKIAEKIKAQVNDNITATFDYDDIGLTLRYFPSIGLRMGGLKLAGQGEFEGDTLARAESLDVAVDVISLIRSRDQTEIDRIHLEEPVIYLIVTEDGKANYDIMKESGDTGPADTSAGAPLNLALRSYSIKDAWIAYDDRQADTYIELHNLRHRGSGNFSAEEFDLVSTTLVPNGTISQDGIAWLDGASMEIQNTLHVNTATQTYTFKETVLRVNELELSADGSVSLEEQLEYELAFSTPGNEFKELLSVLPSAYTDDFADVEASGRFALSGQMASGPGEFPSMNVQASVTDASFRYPGAPFGFSEIALNASVRNPGTTANATVIDVPDLRWTLDGKPFKASLQLEDIVEDLDVRGQANGSVDLASLRKAFPAMEAEQLSGLITLDIALRARSSDIANERYEQIDLRGTAGIDELVYDLDQMPAFRINRGRLDFSPEQVSLIQLDGTYGSSDFKAKGSLRNALAFLQEKGNIHGEINVQSIKADANEWIVPEDTSTGTTTLAEVPSYLERLDIAVEGQVQTLLYDAYTFKNGNFRGRLKGQNVNIEQAEMDFEGNSLYGDGQLGNIWDYSYLGEDLTGNLTVVGDRFDLNPIMNIEPAGAAEGAAEESGQTAYVVPDKLAIDIKADFNTLIFQKLELNKVSGVLSLRNGVASLQDMSSNLLGGRMLLNGYYDTGDPDQPTLSMDYSLEGLGFQPAFKQVNTFAILAPIAEYIEGQFNSTLSLKTGLQPDLMPVLSSIDAQGFFQTINGVVQSFPPLEAAASKLGLDFIRNINLGNTKNWFEVQDGQVRVKPFTINEGDYAITVSGTHGLDNQIDYQLALNVPYTKLASKVREGQPLEALSEQASKLGINLSQDIRLDLLINLGGTIKNPEVSFKLAGAGGTSIKDQLKDEVDKKIDSLKRKGLDKVDSIRRDVTDRIDEKKQELSQELEQRISMLRLSAERRAESIREQARKLADKTREEGYEQADNLLEAAGDNPLKKFAAEKAAAKLRRETDEKVQDILDEADQKANSILQRSEQRVDSLQSLQTNAIGSRQ